MKEEVLKQFRTIPGVGKAIANDLWDLGYRGLYDLVGQDPEKMYASLCNYQNTKVDRCMQYVFRCCVYYVSTKDHDPELLKWWNWKNRKLNIKERYNHG